jgi:hypothetical protein
MKAKQAFTLLAALIVAAPALANWQTPVDPYGTTTSGAGRAFAGALPTPAGPLGSKSGVWRAIVQVPAPSPTDPEIPISGAGRMLADGSVVDPTWPKPNSGAGRILS